MRQLKSADLCGGTGTQDFVGTAPLNLVYVARGARMVSPRRTNAFFASADASFIGQNVDLFCASEGLATVVDQKALARGMRLELDEFVTFAQTFGYPK